MVQPRDTGKLELRRRAEHDVQPLEVTAAGVPNRNPRIQRLVQRGSGVDRAELERRHEPGSEHQQARDAHGQSMHEGHPLRHRPPAPGERGRRPPVSNVAPVRSMFHMCIACPIESLVPAGPASVPVQRQSLISASAIWTLLSAAPLRTLSETIHMSSPRGQEMSSRIRPTNTASVPADSVTAVG